MGTIFFIFVGSIYGVLDFLGIGSTIRYIHSQSLRFLDFILYTLSFYICTDIFLDDWISEE